MERDWSTVTVSQGVVRRERKVRVSVRRRAVRRAKKMVVVRVEVGVAVVKSLETLGNMSIVLRA